jgi:hypothetical protein
MQICGKIVVDCTEIVDFFIGSPEEQSSVQDLLCG